MKKHLRTLLVGVSALVALGTMSACSGGTSTEATSSPTPAPATTTATESAFPQSARYVADMKAADGKTMTIGISVDGTDVAAYACNGTDDEAWFFGNQTDGKIDLKSRFRDTLTAQFDGTDVKGDLTMNGVAYQFTAAPVSGVAGMYTADADGVRASWVVREDVSAIGVQFDPSHRSETRGVRPAATQRGAVPHAGTKHAPAAAGQPDRVPVEQEREVDDQRPGRDPDPRHRQVPARLTKPRNGPPADRLDGLRRAVCFHHESQTLQRHGGGT